MANTPASSSISFGYGSRHYISDLKKLINNIEEFSDKKKDGKVSKEEIKAYQKHLLEESKKDHALAVEKYKAKHPEADGTDPLFPPLYDSTGATGELLNSFDELEDNKTGKKDGILSIEDLWKEHDLQLAGKGIQIKFVNYPPISGDN